MAVIATQLDSVVIARYQTGVSASGAPILSQKSLAGIKASATDQDAHDVVSTLFGLLQYPLAGVRRDNRFDLTDEQ